MSDGVVHDTHLFYFFKFSDVVMLRPEKANAKKNKKKKVEIAHTVATQNRGKLHYSNNLSKKIANLMCHTSPFPSSYAASSCTKGEKCTGSRKIKRLEIFPFFLQKNLQFWDVTKLRRIKSENWGYFTSQNKYVFAVILFGCVRMCKMKEAAK